MLHRSRDKVWFSPTSTVFCLCFRFFFLFRRLFFICCLCVSVCHFYHHLHHQSHNWIKTMCKKCENNGTTTTFKERKKRCEKIGIENKSGRRACAVSPHTIILSNCLLKNVHFATSNETKKKYNRKNLELLLKNMANKRRINDTKSWNEVFFKHHNS